MTTYKSQADAIMMAMDMYARTHGFYAEHNAFWAEPTNDYAYIRLGNQIDRGNSSVSEDRLVKYVYRYYMRAASDGFKDSYEVHQMSCNMNDLRDMRFPKPMSQAYYADLLADRLRTMKRPDRVVADIASVVARHRPWFSREVDRNPSIHASIFKAWDYADPADVYQLILEWPHDSKEGNHRIAYTRDERYGEADRQVVTTVPKYLARHFPAISSSTIRDIGAMFVEAQIGIVRTMPEMLDIIKHGPGSCMSGGEDEFSTCVHPYETYDPQYGWHMAYVKEGDVYTGRAVLNDETWVRTYRGNPKESAYSQADDRLNVWLKEQGYRKASSWSGFKLKRIDESNDCGFVAPYLDGEDKDVDVYRNHLDIVSDGDGEFVCNETCGNAAERSPCRCSSCNDRTNEDDMYSVGRSGDDSVCQNCYENDYTVVYGRRGDRYAVPNDDAVEADDEYYDCNWLEDNGIVRLHDGEYTHQDNAVYINSVDEYYPSESDYICYTQAGEWELREDCVELENGEWCLTDEAWCCEHSGDYYAKDDVMGVMTKCGKLIHPDHAGEYETENDDAAPVSAE
jgi:hypothetical protein